MLINFLNFFRVLLYAVQGLYCVKHSILCEFSQYTVPI